MKKGFSIAVSLLLVEGIACAASLTLLRPNGGELCLGRNFDITWTASGLSAGARVKLILFKDGDRVGLIADDLEASGSPYLWEVGRHRRGTEPAGPGYSICLRTMDNAVEDCDNTAFTIKECHILRPPSRGILRPPPIYLSATTVRVTYPNTNVTLTHGNEVSITWEHANARPGQMVKVFLKRYTARCHQETGFNLLIPLGTLPLEGGHLSWDVAPTFFPWHTYSIRLEPAVTGDFAPDESDECFKVESRTTVQVLTPNGGETFARGSTIPVRLRMTYFVPRFMRVQVYLWRYDDSCGSGIVGTYVNGFDSNLSECDCTIHPDLPAGKYKIDIGVYAGELYHPSGLDPLARYAYDSSDACFTVR